MIYILEFNRPLGNLANRRAQARYYVGWCKDGELDRRISEHRRGEGAAITRYAVTSGISFNVVLTLPGDRTVEKQIKRQHNTPRFVQQQLRKQVCNA